jgi:hypothetical protein
MELHAIIQHINAIRAEIDVLRPVDAEQEARVMQMFRLESRGDYLLALETADAGDLTDFVALVGEALLRSLKLYLKAARGESLEEPGAFEQQVLRLHEELAPYGA